MRQQDLRQQELGKIVEEDPIHLEGLNAVVAAKEAIIAAFNKVMPFFMFCMFAR